MEWNNQEQPWYKRLWFIVVATLISLAILIGIIVGLVISLSNNDEDKSWLEFPPESEIENVIFYKTATVDFSTFKPEEGATWTTTVEGTGDVIIYVSRDKSVFKLEAAVKSDSVMVSYEDETESSIQFATHVFLDTVWYYNIFTNEYINETINYAENVIYNYYFFADNFTDSGTMGVVAEQYLDIGKGDNYIVFDLDTWKDWDDDTTGEFYEGKYEVDIYAEAGEYSKSYLSEGFEFVIDKFDTSLSAIV